LFYSNSKKLETTATGVSISGVCAATSFTGDGSALSNLSGTVLQILNKSQGTFGAGTSWGDVSGFSLAITPLSSTSTIWCHVSFNGCRKFNANTGNGGYLKIQSDTGSGFVDRKVNYPFAVGLSDYDLCVGSDVLEVFLGTGSLNTITYKIQAKQVTTPGTNGTGCWVASARMTLVEYEA
jgi:hypothetical protein